MTEAIFKMKTELELLREAAKEAKAGFDKLSSQLAELEAKKKWSPKGGDWYLDSRGKVFKDVSYAQHRNFGIERDTEAEVKDLRKKQEWLNLTHAYACENDGVQEFVYGEENWCIFETNHSIKTQPCFNVYDYEKVYMTKRDATGFARLCRKGLINFQFQENL